ncbi:MAG: hypothetical protein AB7S41_19915 [Parvibaculaceae bacterium]
MTNLRRLAMPLMAVAGVLLAGCSRYEITLAPGYAFVADWLSYVTGPGIGLAVGENVTRYMRFGNHLVGERVAESDPRFKPDPPETYGFFILDMGKGELREGMDEAAFRKALAERGLPAEPFTGICRGADALIPFRYFCDGFEAPTFDAARGKSSTISGQ